MTVLAPGTDYELLDINYQINASPGNQVNLCFCDTIGQPPVETIITVENTTHVPTQVCGSIVAVSGAPPIIRGDCNDDGACNIGDAIFILDVLFGGGGSANCKNACDTNDDGALNIADPTYKLNFLFLVGSPPPPSPYPDCGPDPTYDQLGCVSYQSCP